MDNVTFDSEGDLARPAAVHKSSQGITAWLVAKKFAKDEKQANYILIGILVTCLVITGFAIVSIFSTGASVDEAERIRLEESTRTPQ